LVLIANYLAGCKIATKRQYVLQAGPGEAFNRMRRKTERNCRRRGRWFGHCLIPFLRFAAFVCVVGSPQRGVNEPWSPFGSCMDVQVPPRTNFQALPWKSAVEVP
jgi:hypothetical protein